MYVRGATIRHPFRGYADRAGFIKFVQLSGLFRNALAYFNGTGYKRNLLLFSMNYNMLFFE